MAYVPTNWVDAVTPVDAVHMNKIEAELVALDVKPGMDLSYDGDWVAGTYQEGDTVVKDGIVWLCVGGPTTTPPDYTLWGTLGPVAGGGLPADTVVPAATRIVANKLLAGDAQPAFRFMGDGRHEWGPGGATAPDTNLYRSGVGNLKTDAALIAAGGFFTSLGTANQVIVASDGHIYFGSASDVNLYRVAADTLKTDDAFFSAADVIANAGSVANQIWLHSGGRIYFGTAADTSLYRSAAGTLKTDGTLIAGLLQASSGATRVEAGNIYDGAKAAIALGGDAVLYRFLAGYLKTDSNILVGNFLAVDHNNIGGGLYFGDGSDAKLFRFGAGFIKSSKHLMAAHNMYVNHDDFSGGGISFGSAGDTFLYRFAAGGLKTDGQFQAANLLINQALPIRIGLGIDAAAAAAGENWTTLFYNSGAGRAVLGSLSQAVAWHSVEIAPNAATLSPAFTIFPSDRGRKLDVKLFDGKAAIKKILTAHAYTYKRYDKGETRLGLMADELPKYVAVDVPDGDNGMGHGVDLYSLISVMLLTIQQLNTRLKALEA